MAIFCTSAQVVILLTLYINSCRVAFNADNYNICLFHFSWMRKVSSRPQVRLKTEFRFLPRKTRSKKERTFKNREENIAAQLPEISVLDHTMIFSVHNSAKHLYSQRRTMVLYCLIIAQVIVHASYCTEENTYMHFLCENNHISKINLNMLRASTLQNSHSSSSWKNISVFFYLTGTICAASKKQRGYMN